MFSHEEMLLKLVNADSEKKRFKASAEFLVRAFYGGFGDRPQAKKPYNPILGEYFSCIYKLNNSLIAEINVEQVSHHPPVSAVSCKIKNILEINATISTSSKYLGLSVGCNLVGGIEIKYLNDNSVVSINNLPTIYMKSILTNPWVELGGRTSIKYKSLSGYVLFHQKPVYSLTGDDLHKVTGCLGET